MLSDKTLNTIIDETQTEKDETAIKINAAVAAPPASEDANDHNGPTLEVNSLVEETNCTRLSYPPTRRHCQAHIPTCRRLTPASLLPPVFPSPAAVPFWSATHPRAAASLGFQTLPSFYEPLNSDSLLQPQIRGTRINQLHNKPQIRGESSAQYKPTDLPMYSKDLVTSFPTLSSNYITSSLAPSTNVFPKGSLMARTTFLGLNQ